MGFDKVAKRLNWAKKVQFSPYWGNFRPKSLDFRLTSLPPSLGGKMLGNPSISGKSAPPILKALFLRGRGRGQAIHFTVFICSSCSLPLLELKYLPT